MYDLHTHTIFSDGVLLPSELVQRAKDRGYKGIAITDHVDFSNLDFVIDRLFEFYYESGSDFGIDVIIGVEITHVPPRLIEKAVYKARAKGVKLVIVHGETLVEPVEQGTNRAAIEAGADILAHPGLIKEEEVKLASEKGVYLEISTRKGHCYTNGHVASLARKYEAKLIINNDAHEPGDLVPFSLRKRIALGSGLSEEEFDRVEKDTSFLFQKLLTSKVLV